jgi:hypothetical protein
VNFEISVDAYRGIQCLKCTPFKTVLFQWFILRESQFSPRRQAQSTATSAFAKLTASAPDEPSMAQLKSRRL